MSNFRTPFGLPTRFEFESGHHIENEFLFGMYEYIMTNRQPLKSDHALYKYYAKANNLGFPNHVVSSVPEKVVSHDQLTAYACFSVLFALPGVEALTANISGFKYKALGQSNTLHPRDYFYYKLLDKSWIGFLGLPVIYLLAVFSMLIPYRITYDKVIRPDELYRLGNFIIRPKLSGELLYVLKTYCVKDDIVLRLVMEPVRWIVKFGAWLRFGDVQAMVRRYFMDRNDHPVVFNYNFKY